MLVIDATVAIKWFAVEFDSAKAFEVLAHGGRLAAPDFALAEIANGLRRKERQKFLSTGAVQQAIEGLPRVFDVLSPCAPHLLAATRLSQQLDHSVYDCIYLIVAQSLGAQLLTADGKFASKLSNTAFTSKVVLLHDWKA